MAIGGQAAYPSLETIANLARAFVNDDQAGATGTPGEGQVLTDTSTTLLNLMNSAIREVYRDLKISNHMALIKDNEIILGLPPVNSYLGVGVANPAVQTAIQFTGYFDGMLMWPNLAIPSDLILPLDMWERQSSNTQGTFSAMTQSSQPLSASMQSNVLGEWEWRTDSIWLHGATVTTDVRLRYIATYPDVMAPGINMSSTYVPILDCQEAVADKISVRYARRLGGDALEDAKQQADASMWVLRCQMSRQRQQIAFQMPAYGETKAAGGTPAQWLY